MTRDIALGTFVVTAAVVVWAGGTLAAGAVVGVANQVFRLFLTGPRER